MSSTNQDHQPTQPAPKFNFHQILQQSIGTGLLYEVTCPHCNLSFIKKNWTMRQTKKVCRQCQSPLNRADGKVIK